MGYVRIGFAVAAWMLMAGVVTAECLRKPVLRMEMGLILLLVMAPSAGLVVAAVVARNRVGWRVAVTTVTIVLVLALNLMVAWDAVAIWLSTTGRARLPRPPQLEGHLLWIEYAVALLGSHTAFGARRRPPPKTDPES